MTDSPPLAANRSAFRRLSAAVTANAFCFFGEQVVVAYLAFRLTDNSIWVGVCLGLYYAPMLAFGLTAGGLADRFSRRQLLITSEAVTAVLLLGLSLLVGVTQLPLWGLIVACLTVGTGRALFHTLRGSIAYDLVPGAHATLALGRLNLGARTGQLIGAFAAGSVVEYHGVASAYGMLSAMQLLSLVLVLGLPTLPQPPRSAPLRESLRELRVELTTNRILGLLLVLTAAVEVLGFSFITALPEIALEKLHQDAQGLGILHAARAAGGIIAAAVYSTVVLGPRPERLYAMVILGFGVALILIALAPSLRLACLALMLIAVLSVSTDILSQSMMQGAVADGMRGRAMGVWVFALGAAPLGHVELGLLSTFLSPSAGLAINGAILFVLGLVLGPVLVAQYRKTR
ncbi:MAG: MFS transporter [Pseudomonadota bacterium]